MSQQSLATTLAGILAALLALPAQAVPALPILWEAGGLSAGTNSAGQAYRIAADSAGDLAVVSGPSQGRDLAVTSYTSDGTFRWQRAVSPASGVFLGDWVVAAANGDFVAVGHAISGSSGDPIGITIIRVAADGTLLWRDDIAGWLPSVGRLVVDSTGNSYLAFNSVGDGQDIHVRAYSPGGTEIWTRTIATGPLSNNYATSLALSPDESEIALTGDTLGGAEWITALYDTASGARRWLVVAPEGVATSDVVMDDTTVYVTGQGNVGIATYLTVIAYDRSSSTRMWRRDAVPADGTGASGLRIARAPDGSLSVAGQAQRGFLDWYTVAFKSDGTPLWEAVRDGGLPTDEVPAAVLVLPDGTTVVTGTGGPPLPGGFIQGVTAGYDLDGVLQWEAFSRLATKWAATPNDDLVCTTGGYDAYLTCFGLAADWYAMVPDGFRTPGPPFLLDRSPDGSLSARWSVPCAPRDADYTVYEGVLLRPFRQHAPIICSTVQATSATIAPAAGNTYYLISAHDQQLEGLHGQDSFGNLRSSGVAQCVPTATRLGCP